MLKTIKQWIKSIFNKPNYVYVVTMISKLECSELIEGLLAEGCWTVGIFHDYEAACEVLDNNTTDLWETMYTYAVIEKVETNYLYACFSTKWTEWYKYNMKRNSYQPIEVPETMELNNGFWE